MARGSRSMSCSGARRVPSPHSRIWIRPSSHLPDLAHCRRTLPPRVESTRGCAFARVSCSAANPISSWIYTMSFTAKWSVPIVKRGYAEASLAASVARKERRLRQKRALCLSFRFRTSTNGRLTECTSIFYSFANLFEATKTHSCVQWSSSATLFFHMGRDDGGIPRELPLRMQTR